MDRRDFLKILGVTSGTAMIVSCGVDKANEKIIPYVVPPKEEIYPGKALYYNSMCTECPAGCGLQVKVQEKVYHEERGLFPTKLEGIAGHPINDGALCMRGQAGLFRLYHPDRLKRPMIRDSQGNWRIATWNETFERIVQEMNHSSSTGRENVYLSGYTTGSLSDLLNTFCREMKVKRLAQYEALFPANIRMANQLVFEFPEIPRYDIQSADYMLTLGADLFETFLSPVSFASQVSRARSAGQFSWTHIEPHLSLTGAQSPHRINILPKTEPILMAYLVHQLFRENLQKKPIPAVTLQMIPDYSEADVSQKTGIAKDFLLQVKTDLFRAQNPLVIAGGASIAHERGLETTVLVALLQYAMGMVEKTVDFTHAFNYAEVGDLRNMRRLQEDLDESKIGVVFFSRTDPVSTLPEGIRFAESLKKASLRVVMSDHKTTTVENCDIILPLSHALESWGDAVPSRGLRNVMQPAIEPQYDTLGEGDILLSLMGSKRSHQSFKEYLEDVWKNRSGLQNVGDILQKGYDSREVAAVRLSLSGKVSNFLKQARFDSGPSSPLLLITPSIRTFDGRGKALPLLQEIPDPLTTVTYGEWLSVSDKTAGKLDLKDRDEVRVSAGHFSILLPVKIQKLLPDNIFMIQRDLISLPEMIMDERSGEIDWYIQDVTLSRTGKRIALPILSGSMAEEGRGLLPHQDEHGHGHEDELSRWYPEHEHKDYRWGMAIDLESCIGCNACAAACYVENNLPIVGREEHLLGREMSWIRIQPYLDQKKEIEFVPMLCQHCDNAPCEPVCPVYAAYHNPEGLNVQVYNRCVGTRYCANNCPYKVRRFNWFDHRLEVPWDKMYNPDVSVRDRGIMEKCTFCIQRIRSAKDHAKDQGRLVQDGEMVPACAQTCPTRAITFGNLMDEKSKVYQLAHSPRVYRALEELGTEPAVNYLRKRGNNHEA